MTPVGMCSLTSAASSDSFHVPFDTLNLQRVSLPTGSAQFLPFSAPEEETCTAFLSLVALSEGHSIPAASILDLYRATSSRPYPAWMLQQQMGTARRAGGGGSGSRPLAPGSATQPLSSPDLRKALVQLELECQRGADVGSVTPAGQVVLCEGSLLSRRRDEEVAVEAATGPTREATLQVAAAASDALSWADAHVDRRIETMIDVSDCLLGVKQIAQADALRSKLFQDAETGRTSHPNDMEYSHPIVGYLPNPNSTRLPSIGAEREMAQCLRTLAGNAWGDALRFGEHEDEKLETARSVSARHLNPRLCAHFFSPDVQWCLYDVARHAGSRSRRSGDCPTTCRRPAFSPPRHRSRPALTPFDAPRR